MHCPICTQPLENGELVMVCGHCHKALGGGLVAGATGTAAIYTEAVKPTHIIRKVLLRQIAILNYVNPF